MRIYSNKAKGGLDGYQQWTKRDNVEEEIEGPDMGGDSALVNDICVQQEAAFVSVDQEVGSVDYIVSTCQRAWHPRHDTGSWGTASGEGDNQTRPTGPMLPTCCCQPEMVSSLGTPRSAMGMCPEEDMTVADGTGLPMGCIMWLASCRSAISCQSGCISLRVVAAQTINSASGDTKMPHRIFGSYPSCICSLTTRPGGVPAGKGGKRVCKSSCKGPYIKANMFVCMLCLPH